MGCCWLCMNQFFCVPYFLNSFYLHRTFIFSVKCPLRREFELIINSPFGFPVFCYRNHDRTSNCANNKAMRTDWTRRNDIRFAYNLGWNYCFQSRFKKGKNDGQFLSKEKIFNYRHHWLFGSLHLFCFLYDFQLYLCCSLRVSYECTQSTCNLMK